MTLRIAIVGCGVAGSVLGTVLAGRPGIDLVCFEKASLGEHAEAGTGLNVGPNAMKALRLVAPDLAARVRAASFDWTRWAVSHADGRPIFDFALTELADEPGIRIRWSELYRVLREPLADVARFGVQVTGCGFDRERPATLFVDYRDAAGTARREAGFDLVVAGDGRYSALRETFAEPLQVRHVGATIYRLLVADTSAGLIDDYAWWFNGPKRLLAFRVPPDRVYIAGSFPMAPGTDIPAGLKTPEALARHYLPANGEPCAEVRWMVDQLVRHAEQIHWARLQESPPLFHDASGRVLFLGDSAHGMVPTLGQGATQAMEDACVAGALIARAPADASAATLTETIAAARRDRVRWVMDFSLDATAAMFEGADPQAAMGRLRDDAYRAAFRRLWSDVALT